MFTKEHEDWIRANCVNKFDAQIAKEFNEYFGTDFKVSQITSFKKRKKIKSGCLRRENHFMIGGTPYNKRANLHETKDSLGYTRIKVNDKWLYKHRYLYEKYHNVKLNKNDNIIFLDGNKENFEKDNLILMKKDEHIYLHRKFNDIKDKDLKKACVYISKIEMTTRRERK